jgi:hypothetical protein
MPSKKHRAKAIKAAKATAAKAAEAAKTVVPPPARTWRAVERAEMRRHQKRIKRQGVTITSTSTGWSGQMCGVSIPGGKRSNQPHFMVGPKILMDEAR